MSYVRLVDRVKAVAEKRRHLPLGGQLKEDYTLQWANDGKVGTPGGRPDIPTPPQNFRSEYLEKHYLNR